MVLLRSTLFISLAFGLVSCAKLSYLVEQGIGQLSLLNNAEDNQEVLKDVTISKSSKGKIKLVGVYKSYFYKYWKKDSTEIYSKTTILKQDAVTYLVTASKHNEILAYRVSFPFMGSFPYLGFFKHESAKEYEKKLQSMDYVTFIRPVYAYSTLGHFTDTILSSFFKYDEYNLAELVFHELFHTIFFIKDEVQLNENLANYFAVKMVEKYFPGGSSKIQKRKIFEKKLKKLRKEIYILVKKLNTDYKKVRPQTQSDSLKVLNSFLSNDFLPKIKLACARLKIVPKLCYPLHRTWNNARFVAFLTYEQDGNDLTQLQAKQGLKIRDFYAYIEAQYTQYKNSSKKGSFKSYLFLPLKNEI